MAFVQARVNAAIDAAASGITHVQLHDGAPGGAGTSNVAAGVDRAAVTGVGGASGGSDTWTCEFAIPGAGGPFTHVSFWTASESGTFYGDGELATPVSFEVAGTLGVTVTITGS